MRWCSTLKGDVPQPCARRPCDSCVDDLAERAALIADGCKVSQDEAMRMARAQALAEMPGQRKLVAV